MTQTMQVTGANAHPIFQHLIAAEGEPSWNFNKYLVDKNGQVIDRFRQWTSPTSRAVSKAIEAQL